MAEEPSKEKEEGREKEKQEKEQEASEEKQEKADNKVTEKLKKDKERIEEKIIKNPWFVSTVTFALISLVLFVVIMKTPPSITGRVLSENDAATQIKEIIGKVYGIDLEFQSVMEKEGLYEISYLLEGRRVILTTTKDGSFIKLPNGNWIRTKDFEDFEAKRQQTPESEEIPKSDRPKAELFVMSFCPYGVKAENAMKPVYDLLKEKADFNIMYIVNIAGNNISDVRSLHGAIESEEDARQACIAKYYPKKLWDYVIEIDEKCYPEYRDASKMEKCWKSAASKLKISVATIERCVGSEAINILKEHEASAGKYGVSGSPTLIINGARYSGERTPEAYKKAMCSAFKDIPDECNETITPSANSVSSSSGSGGSCG